MKRALSLVFVLLAVTATPASARSVQDANDVRGRLDLSAVSFSKFAYASGAIYLRFQWSTYETWTLRQCRKAQTLEDGCLIHARLDTKGPRAWRPTGRGIDYEVRWSPKGCTVVDPQTDHVVTTGAAHKAANFVMCTFRRRALTIRKKIRWYAFTQWANVQLGWFATDYVPDQGWVE